jgi:hypothetical protein
MSQWTIAGRILVRETQRGLRGVVVRAIWQLEQGKNDGLTEREARIEENRYRNARGAKFHRELP